MRRIWTRAILIAGVISGIVVAWLVQPFFLPPYSAHARVAVASGDDRAFFHRAHELLAISARAQNNGYKGPSAYGMRTSVGSHDLEVFFTSHNRGLSLAVVNDWVGRMLEERPGLPVLVPPERDRFEDPAWPTIPVGALLGWLAASKFAGRSRHSEEYPDWER